jgi:cytochrome c peroxidase
MSGETQYCGMFLTPTLRNATTRQVFFHNGVDHTLQQVMDFYDFRDTDPAKIYPPAAEGVALKYDDVPEKYRANVDVTDPPFDRKPGDPPAMTAEDEAAIIAFLQALTDGYEPR